MSAILFYPEPHADIAVAVLRVFVLQHEPPQLLGKPIVAVLGQNQPLLPELVPILSTDVPQMIEEIVDGLTKLCGRIVTTVPLVAGSQHG
jgi:hypothetical protein